MKLTFTVWGIPQPKGSARAFVPKGWKRPIITSDNKSLRAWEDVIRAELQRVMAESSCVDRAALFNAPIVLTLNFHLPRPKAARGRSTLPVKKPDLSKLIRGAEDALTGLVFQDDAQVVAIIATKVYADGPACVRFTVESSADALLPLVTQPTPEQETA